MKSRMIPVLVAVALCALVISTAEEADCHKDRLIRLGFECLKLPCDLQATELSGFPDAAIGYIEPSDGSWRVNWMSGLWENLLSETSEREVVWERSEYINGRRFRIGLVEDGGRRMYVLQGGAMLQIAVPEAVDSGLELIRSLAADLHSTPTVGECSPPQKRD